jgi:hypothetical protein
MILSFAWLQLWMGFCYLERLWGEWSLLRWWAIGVWRLLKVEDCWYPLNTWWSFGIAVWPVLSCSRFIFRLLDIIKFRLWNHHGYSCLVDVNKILMPVDPSISEYDTQLIIVLGFKTEDAFEPIWHLLSEQLKFGLPS